jgi:hypothetical protein
VVVHIRLEVCEQLDDQACVHSKREEKLAKRKKERKRTLTVRCPEWRILLLSAVVDLKPVQPAVLVDYLPYEEAVARRLLRHILLWEKTESDRR